MSIRITKNEFSLLEIPNFLNPQTMTTATTPSALSEFNCAGVALGYKTAPNKGLCTFSDASVEGIGHLAGLVSFTKGTAQNFTIDNVLLGEEVRAFAMGFKDASNYGCVNLGPGFKPEDYGYSEGYILASNDFNTASNGVIDLVSDYNSATTPYVSHCDPAILDKPQTTTASLLNNLTSYWDFNDNTNISDLQGVNNLTASSPSAVFNVNIGGRDAFDFTGSNNGLSLVGNATAFNLAAASVMTVSFWMRSVGPTSTVLFYKTSAANTEGWKFGFDGSADPQPYFSLDDSVNSASQYNISGTGGICRFIKIGTAEDVNQWLHYVVVVDFSNNIIKSYKNGVYCGSPPAITPHLNASSTGVLKFGTLPPGATEYVEYLDEVGIWSRELSASEVTRLYNSGSGLPFSSF